MQNRRNFVPAVPDEDILSSPPEPQPEPPLVRNSVGPEVAWAACTLAVLLGTIVLIVAMMVDGNTAQAAVKQGVRFFLTAMFLFAVVLSGTLTDIIRGWLHEKTERQRIESWEYLGDRLLELKMLAEQNHRLELQQQALPVHMERRLADLEMRMLETGPQTPERTRTFVPAYDNRQGGAFADEVQPAHDTTADEALSWVTRELYTDTGAINRHRVQLTTTGPQRGKIINGPVIGSKRGDGSGEALEWLLRKRVLKKIPGGYALNVDMFPRREELRYVR